MALTFCSLLFTGCQNTVGGNMLSGFLSGSPRDASFEKNANKPVILPPHSERVELTDLGGDRFTARLKDTRHVFRQKNDETWCWAACAAMLHAIQDNPITQEEIVERIQGMEGLSEEQRRGANYFEVIRALAPETA